jgi:hypothetical protein
LFQNLLAGFRLVFLLSGNQYLAKLDRNS